MGQKNANVVIFQCHEEADAAFRDLERSGFDMRQFSIAGPDWHTSEHAAGYYRAGERTKCWGSLGAFWTGIWSLLSGWGYFAIPGISPVLVAGPLAGWIAAALENGPIFGGLTAFGAALYSIGIPKDGIRQYEAALDAGNYLVIAHGRSADVDRAHDILRSAQRGQL